MKKKVLFIFIFLSLFSTIFSITNLLDTAVKIFIDCDFCDHAYIKEQIPFVNYVRDRKNAEVHILMTRQETASGGYKYFIEFIGKFNFTGINDYFNENQNE